MDHYYALIMAGGAGTRLWPLSRQGRPKPLLPLVEQDRSMFQHAVDRLLPVFAHDHITVIAGAEMTPALQAQAPDLPVENFIIEPMGRDTAPAVGLGAIHIRHRDPEAIIAVLTADHFIRDTGTFLKVLGVARQVAAQGNVVTLGIKPGFPSTGFGYIQQGALDQVVDGVEVYVSERFTEKPEAELARTFFESGQYSWNSGMFIWPVRRLMNEFQQHVPALHANLERLGAAIGQEGYADLLARTWPGVTRISVDFALMENIKTGVRVIPVSMGWSDIGSFGALYDILEEEGEDANVLHAPDPVVIDTRRTLVVSDRLVAAIGLEDLVIVDTDDVLLVCRRDRVQDVKQVVNRLKEEKRSEYL